jgi:hypothetical protein
MLRFAAGLVALPLFAQCTVEALSCPRRIEARLEANSSCRGYQFAAPAGQRLRLQIQASFAARVTLRDRSGNEWLTGTADTSFTVPYSGDWIAEVRGEAGPFQLNLSGCPGGCAGPLRRLTCGTALEGSIGSCQFSRAGEGFASAVHLVAVQAGAAVRVAFQAEFEAGVSLVSPNGLVLATGTGRAVELKLTVPLTSEDYRVEITATQPGVRGDYRVTASQCAATLEACEAAGMLSANSEVESVFAAGSSCQTFELTSGEDPYWVFEATPGDAGPAPQLTLAQGEARRQWATGRLATSRWEGPAQLRVEGSGSFRLRYQALYNDDPVRVYVVHGIGQTAEDMVAFAGLLRNPQLGLDPTRFSVDASFTWRCASDRLCDPQRCAMTEGGRLLAEHIAATSPESARVVLIGYSLGGLLAREAIVSGALGARRVEGLVTLGTPHLGYPRCDIDAAAFCSSIIQQIASALRPGFPEGAGITNLNARWRQLENRPRWLAISGMACRQAQRPGFVCSNGCPNEAPYSDNLVCTRSAESVAEGVEPTLRLSDTNYVHTKSFGALAAFALMCGSRDSQDSLSEPAGASELFEAVKRFIDPPRWFDSSAASPTGK